MTGKGVVSGVRAYCAECKRMVSDDLYTGDGGTVNKHEHDVLILLERGTVPPGAVIASIMEMTPETYLQYASQLDAELIVGRIKARYNIPFGEKIITDIVSIVLRAVREAAVELEAKDRKKAALRKKLDAAAVPGKQTPKSKRESKPKEETLT